MNGIVVGIDGSEGSRAALRWAAAEARLRGLPLTAVLAWQTPTVLYTGMPGITEELLTDFARGAAEKLDEALRDSGVDLAGITVQTVVQQGQAAAVLIRAAEAGDLLVVGTRGHGGFAELLLGSVSQSCAHHAPCPVVIVPPAGR